MSEELLRLWERVLRDRALLRGLLRAAAQLAQALSGLRLEEVPASLADLPLWLAAYDRVATAANAPSYREWFGVSLSPFPAEPPLPWIALVAQASRAREPGIASAIRSASGAYAAIRRDGSPELRAAVSDEVVRRWIRARLTREAATGPGTGLQPRALRPSTGNGGMVLAALGAAVVLSRGGDTATAGVLLAGGLYLATRTR